MQAGHSPLCCCFLHGILHFFDIWINFSRPASGNKCTKCTPVTAKAVCRILGFSPHFYSQECSDRPKSKTAYGYAWTTAKSKTRNTRLSSPSARLHARNTLRAEFTAVSHAPLAHPQPLQVQPCTGHRAPAYMSRNASEPPKRTLSPLNFGGGGSNSKGA